jgi:uncharacterized phage-associated protein
MGYAAVREVEAELLQRRPHATAWQVHKLLYLTQGFYLAWAGKPMFGEKVEAWKDGPVVPDLWHGLAAPSTRPLDDGELSVLNYVNSRFGWMTGPQLRDLTHREGPWCDVWGNRGSDDRGSDEITTWQMKDWFQQDGEFRALLTEAERTGRRWRELVLAEESPGLAASLERVLSGNPPPKKGL